MKIVKHKWEYSATNEYCIHCGLIFESDLGWTSADDVKCVERDITSFIDMPDSVKSYANFKGYRYDSKDLKFKKAYSEEEYTPDQLNEIISNLNPS